MVLFEVYAGDKAFTYVSLDGINFHRRLQFIVNGQSYFKKFPTINYKASEISFKVIDIDIEKDEINRKTLQRFVDRNETHLFSLIRKETIDKNYSKLYSKIDINMYKNLSSIYTEEKLKEMIFKYLFCNVTPKWLSIFYDVDINSIQFLLEYLPTYINFIELEVKEEWLI